MPSLERLGERLYYETRGEPGGFPVVMQHPLCSDLHHFDDTSLPEALLERGCFLIFPESLAHGRSAIPAAPGRYALSERARDVLAVVDALGVERFAFVGYSMGTWIGCGLIDEAPERVLAASFGGFDILRGAHSCGIPRRLTASHIGRGLIAGYALWPQSRITYGGDDRRALQRCFDELYEPMPGLASLSRWDGELLLWSAQRDLYCEPMRAAAKILGARFECFAGHHFSASSDERLVAPVLKLLDGVMAQPAALPLAHLATVP